MLIGLLKTILIFIIVYYVWKIFRIFIIPFTFGRGRQTDHFRNNHHKKEGDVTVHVDPDYKENNNNKNIGQYVDYEEIDDSDNKD